MEPYQESYLHNLQLCADLAAMRVDPEKDLEENVTADTRRLRRRYRICRENNRILQEELFPRLDGIFSLPTEQIVSLEEFAGQLLLGKARDRGLASVVYWALLSYARRKGTRDDLIRLLYWNGMARYYFYAYAYINIETDDEVKAKHSSQIRLCFGEASGYLREFANIESSETRGYILRSVANQSLSWYADPNQKVKVLARAMQVIQDPVYREMAPELPWDTYMSKLHQQTASSLSTKMRQEVSPESVALVMESAQILYNREVENAKRAARKPKRRPMFSYNSILYLCGLTSLDQLLASMEAMIDDPSAPGKFDEEELYSFVNIPAFYYQRLKTEPSRIPRRYSYIDTLNRRALHYLENFPVELIPSRGVPKYLLNLFSVYIEAPGGLTAEEFFLRLAARCFPDYFTRGYAVGVVAEAICDRILREEPACFDDMPNLSGISDPREKRAALLHYARNCGLMYDVGALASWESMFLSSRHLLREEADAMRTHVELGRALLRECPSTAMYAPVAYGHHAWYNGSEEGYPAEFSRMDCQYCQMVDVIALSAWVVDTLYDAAAADETVSLEQSLAAILEQAQSLGGTRFSPRITSWLQVPALRQTLEQALRDAPKASIEILYRLSKAG